MGGDGFQTQKMKSWVSGQVEFWLMRLQNTAVEFLLRNECVDTEGFQRKHEQAKNAKNGHPRVGGGEDWRPQDQQEEIKKLNAQVELLSKQQGTGKRTRAVRCSLTSKRIARKSCSCVHGQLQILIFTFCCRCFATVVQEVQASPAFHWVGAIYVLLPQSEDFPKLNSSGTHPLSRSIWK